MRIPRDLSGADLARLLCKDWGYTVVHQVGSHIILETDAPFHQRIAVPAHKNLRVGTLSAILKAIAKHKGVERAEILRRF
jgi:predicted RNA binding protein YcfA (HicA-like mRNA interferase family)